MAIEIAEARYPPECTPPAGLLRFRPLQVGGVAVEVETRELSSGDFRLSVLFSNGCCIFVDARDLASFWKTAVAAAFGQLILEEQAERDPPGRTTESLVVRPAPPGEEELRTCLAREICGQNDALTAIASAVARHLAKRSPSRPETILLLGPTGSGKTATIQALPEALADFCFDVPVVFRIDCNELTDSYDAKRFLGAAPGLVGYTEAPPLLTALKRPHCIILFDEIEKAHDEVRQVLLGLLDEGRLVAPDGGEVRAPHATIAMTSNVGWDELPARLFRIPREDRWAVQRASRTLLLDHGWPPEFVGRIATFAVFEELGDDAMEDVARRAVDALAREYGFTVADLPAVLLGAIRDIASRGGLDARGLNYAARDLLGAPFADAARAGLEGPVAVDPGPPPRVLTAALQAP